MWYQLLCLLAFTFSLCAAEPLEQRLDRAIPISDEAQPTIGYIKIEDHNVSISKGTWLYVKNALDYYKEQRPLFIILELNTPGGELYPAQLISDALKEMDTQFDVPIVAFINNWAISAGAMLAYSSRFITVVKDASMGAAEPVISGESGKTESVSEKINSAVRTDFGNRAHFFDRNPDLAEGMVDKDIILVWRNGQVVRLDNESQINSEGSQPDVVIKPKGKLLTLNAEQMMKYGVADILLLPKRLEPITSAEEAAGKWPASKSLVFTYPYFEKFQHATIDAYQIDWKTRFFMFLAQPVIASMLLMGLMLGVYMEMSSPGVSLPGSIAFMCLFLLILSNFSQEAVNWLELILLLTGLAILLVEIFILPSFGLLGFVGIVMMLAGLVGILIPEISNAHFDFDTKTFNAAGQFVLERLAWYSGAFVLACILMMVLSRYVTPHIPGIGRFVLSGNEQDRDKGYIASGPRHLLPKNGTIGIAMTTLRPSGKVIFENTIFDAIASSGFIEKGESVIARGSEGGNIIVEPENLA